MKSFQNSEFNMFSTVEEYLKDYPELIAGLPFLPENLTLFKNTNAEIQKIKNQQKTNKKSDTVVKNQGRENSILLIADNARKLNSFALLNNETLLAEKTLITDSKLKRSSDSDVISYGQIIYELAQENIVDLADYGITPQTQTVFASEIAAFKSSIGHLGVKKGETKVLTQKMTALFKTAIGALEKIDAAIEIIRLKNPDFYNGYKAARRIIERGSGTLAVNGTVFDAQTGEPMPGVTVQFAPSSPMAKTATTTNSTIKVEKKTAAKGGFRVKNLSSGTYQVTLKKNGFAEQVITVNVNNGETSKILVKLEKQ